MAPQFVCIKCKKSSARKLDRIGDALFRAIFFLPYILGEIVAGLIWRYMYANLGIKIEMVTADHFDFPISTASRSI